MAKFACGCELVVVYDPTENPGEWQGRFEIKHCPLHAAAPALLAVCRRVTTKAHALANDHHTWVYNTEEGQEIMRLVNEIGEIANAAIAAVEGKD